MKKAGLVLAIIVITMPEFVLADFTDGSGTESDPYQIRTANDLIQLSNSSQYWGDHFIQTADIDLGDPNLPQFTPIGTGSTNPFTGSYNGDGYTIAGFNITGSSYNTGLFGYALGTSQFPVRFSNIHLINPVIEASTELYVGALIGYVDWGNITNCTITNAYVHGRSYTGTLAGYVRNPSIKNCTCSGTVYGGSSSGGFIGYISGGQIQDCKFDGEVNSPGHNNVGGFAGKISTGGIIRCCSKGTVLGGNYTGGFAGYLYYNVEACYSQCDVTGTDYVGGFSGYVNNRRTSYTYIKNCYAAGTINGINNVGGMIGYCSPNETEEMIDFVGCFWNAEINPELPGIGNHTDLDLIGGTTANMQRESTYAEPGWDFYEDSPDGYEGTWLLTEEEYPHLTWETISFRYPGKGTSEDPYLLSTKEHIFELRNSPDDCNKHFKLTADIDMSGYTFPDAIIAQETHPSFTGVFDGGGHIISNITIITENIHGCGFFGLIGEPSENDENAVVVVKNLGLTDIYVDGKSYIGGLCGCVGRNASPDDAYKIRIENCFTTGTIKGSVYYVGGLIGQAGLCQIDNCFSSCNVVGDYASEAYCFGGFVGSGYGVGIENCFAAGNVSSYDFAGGFIGLLSSNVGYPTSVINNSYAIGNVEAYDVLGGFAAYVHDQGINQITHCYSTGSVNGGKNYGGFAGKNKATVAYCYWDRDTSGLSTSAGGVGRTTTQMQTQSTFAFWDFDGVWYMGTYPVLQWELNPLQSQIDAAANGDVVVVQPGVYEGRLYFKGKNITLTSVDPTDPVIVASTVLKGRGIGPVVTFAGTENQDCLLAGFTISGGNGGIAGNRTYANISNCVIENNLKDNAGAGIRRVNGVISACKIINNEGTAGGGLAGCHGTIISSIIAGNSGTVSGINNCDGDIVNCTITGNILTGGGVAVLHGCDGSIINCIIKENSSDVLSNGTAQISYTCMEGGVDNGNIDADPLFALSEDYHLLPDSSCIDAGDPSSSWENEPSPNGARVNMGAHGNTSEATRSRAGLQLVGFNVISKTRIGRTTFRYVLSLSLSNTTLTGMTDVAVKLIDADEQVVSVADDEIFFAVIAAESISDSNSFGDYFTIDVDRSTSITAGRLTWQIDYTEPEGSNMQMMSLGLPAILGDNSVAGDINIADLKKLADKWLWTGTPGSIDEDIAPPPDGDGRVDFLDFAAFVENRME